MKEDLVLLFVGQLIAPRNPLRVMTIMQKKLGTEIKIPQKENEIYIFYLDMGLDFNVLGNNDDRTSNARDRESER
ncbi:hypothetical protein BRARA_B01909 [Brassica rapa]|uniref:Uncharacterized protein n=1 Tax=Brassica campestris TaxID=3711 RepID=A0A398AGU3_BRACM|nr:hypothetical protein BRARA_B01909 [Brassica rapa]